MKKLLITCALLALAGCSTVEGIGKDISAGARTVRDTF
ncbi:entericidin EcnA/B family protein [Actibacterium ureilyticum]|nr:entericidin EcnA/B family protein [Actibacterium ureilyticum]